MERSIFQQYYEHRELVDRFLENKSPAVDVIIPIIHTTELWEANLFSIYREIPVNRLLLGDGGCIDDTIEIAKRFPRVVVVDQKHIKTLGYCIRELIEGVETEWFIYLHSDVYLPSGWFDVMEKYQGQYDWYGCPQQITTMAEYRQVDSIRGERRPYAGSQIGRKIAFVEGLKTIDDDYVYRQEDLVFAAIVENSGYRNGYVDDVFHYHQVMRKESPWAREIKGVTIEIEWSPEEKERSDFSFIRGLIKYLKPTRLNKLLVFDVLSYHFEYKAVNLKDFYKWAVETNPLWEGNINISLIRELVFRKKLRRFLSRMLKFDLRGS